MSCSSTTVCSGERPEGSYLGMIAKRRYWLEAGRLRPRDGDAPDIHLEPVWQRSDAEPTMLHDSDKCGFFKPFTDVVLMGSAYAAGGTRGIDTSLQVGDVGKRVRVIGDRRLRVRRDGQLEASAPEEFERMPLDWSHAYGGRDREAERLGRPDREALLRETRPIQASDVEAIATASYPRNRAGRGFYLDVERARLDGAPLFNLMDPDASNRPEDLLAKSLDDWVARPPAAGYGPVDWLSFPRTFFMGMSTTPLPASCDELRQGALMPNDLVAPPRFPVGDARMHQCAVPGLGSRRLQGSESFALTNLSADAPLLRGTLPRQRPQLLLEPHGTRVFELEPKLSTVLFEPDKRRVTMTWTGLLPVAAPYHPQQCEEMRHAAVWK